MATVEQMIMVPRFKRAFRAVRSQDDACIVEPLWQTAPDVFEIFDTVASALNSVEDISAAVVGGKLINRRALSIVMKSLEMQRSVTESRQRFLSCPRPSRQQNNKNIGPTEGHVRKVLREPLPWKRRRAFNWHKVLL
jgi:hypothetical protein